MRTEQTEAGTDIHLEAYLPEYGTYPMVFTFEGNELKQVQRSFTEVKVDDREKDGILATYSVQTFILEETDKGSIEKQMKINGPVVELVQLYSELDALQAKDSVHLVIEQEFDTDYWAWKSARQEFLKMGNNWYRNFDTKTHMGDTIITSYLCFGLKMYSRQESDTVAVPPQPWAQTDDPGYREPELLTKDWRSQKVLEIQREKDGSSTVIIQGDLVGTESVTYSSQTYEFHLDSNGKLTDVVCEYQVSKQISSVYNGGEDVTGKDTIYIQDTPAEEIAGRIMSVKKEAIG